MSELDHYHYELPRELIAQRPAARRADARLLLVNRQASKISHHHVRDLPELLSPGDALVINDTRVVPARLVGYRTRTGGRWEGLFLTADDQTHQWELVCKCRGKLQPGETITLRNRRGVESGLLRLIEKRPGGVWVVVSEDDRPAVEVLEGVGRIPLPPYIDESRDPHQDRIRYQTVYAQHTGSVAAPTAGLHFTDELLTALIDRQVRIVRLTLHVGLDTFRPVKVEQLAEHTMHSEWGQITPEAVAQLQQARAGGGRIVAVGTTSVRVLETAAASGELQPWTGQTQLFIRPGHQFHAVDAMMTNFHLPRTTLLVLVRTFGGDELIKQAYEVAIREQYRFYSYGDAMLIL